MPRITLKASLEEARNIGVRARVAKAPTISDFLRKVAMDEKPPARRRGVLVKDPLIGLLVGKTPGRIASDQEIQAAQADFP